MTDSSSSSSFYDEEQEEILAFKFSSQKSKNVNCFAFYKEYCFAGMNSDNSVIMSKNRFYWEKFFVTEDMNVSSIIAFKDDLFVGTSPNGIVYSIDLNTKSSKTIQTLNCKISKFFILKNKLYVACYDRPSLYLYDEASETFDLIYSPHANITDVVVTNDYAYLATTSGNPIRFNGESFSLFITSKTNEDNLSSIRKIKQEPFSNVSFSLIERSKMINDGSGDIDNQTWIDVFPYKRLIGINSVEKVGNNIVFGGSNYGRLIRYLIDSSNTSEQQTSLVFDTDASPVYDICNIDDKSMLVSIENKLYFGYYGKITMKSETTVEKKPEAKKYTTEQNIKITSPLGGTYQYGDSVSITWQSTKSINDSVSIDLYKNNTPYYNINSQAPNSGSYSWVIPSEINEGANYKIYIKWLSASSTVNDTDKDLTAETFTIVAQKSDGSSDVVIVPADSKNRWYFIPILDLNSEHITVIEKDNYFGQVIVGTSLGRILAMEKIDKNAYATGEAKAYAMATSEYGYFSRKEQTNVLYSLVNNMAKINQEKELEKYVFCKNATILSNETVNGVFVSPIITVKQDFGFWKNLIWEQNADENTNISIYLRSADTIEELQSKPWEIGFNAEAGETNPITRDLISYDLRGKNIQIKVEVDSLTNNTSSFVSSVSLDFSTKNASYFFTTNFYLESTSDMGRGMLTAKISQPRNTEIYFGITDKKSSEWKDYEIIDPDKFFDTSDINKVKMGIKFVSYDESVPDVSEFAVMLGGKKVNRINLT